jgi:hypothetical protein
MGVSRRTLHLTRGIGRYSLFLWLFTPTVPHGLWVLSTLIATDRVH